MAYDEPRRGTLLHLNFNSIAYSSQTLSLILVHLHLSFTFSNQQQ